MQKIIRLLAIIATALAVCSLILLIVTCPFQRLFAQTLGYPDSILGELPTFPLMPFLQCFLKAGCIALLIMCCGNKKGGIWLEILVVVALVSVLPFFTSMVSSMYQSYIARLGTEKLTANSAISVLSNYCCYPLMWGTALAQVTCGMSIAYKFINKKQNLEQ